MLRPAVLSEHRGQARGESLRGQLADRSAQGTYASMYQATNTANANTITPAQYQAMNTSSLIGRSSLLPGGLYTHSSRLRGVMREVSPRAHRGAWVIGTEALRIVLISREPSDGQERNQNNKDDPNINAHQNSTYEK